MSEGCRICDTERMCFAWTDTHGIAQCVTCGAPYRLYHYENDKRVDKPAECCVSAKYVPRLREYWSTHKRYIPGQASFPGGQELASEDDMRVFYAWLNEHPVETEVPHD